MLTLNPFHGDAVIGRVALVLALVAIIALKTAQAIESWGHAPPEPASAKVTCSRRPSPGSSRLPCASHSVTSFNPYLRSATPSGVGDALSSR